jgi:hypothetical protein
MSRPSSLGDFDVVSGPPAPIRRMAPAMPAPKSDRQQPAPARGKSGAPAGEAEPPTP